MDSHSLYPSLPAINIIYPSSLIYQWYPFSVPPIYALLSNMITPYVYIYAHTVRDRFLLPSILCWLEPPNLHYPWLGNLTAFSFWLNRSLSFTLSLLQWPVFLVTSSLQFPSNAKNAFKFSPLTSIQEELTKLYFKKNNNIRKLMLSGFNDRKDEKGIEYLLIILYNINYM